jgi:hypothetical protein
MINGVLHALETSIHALNQTHVKNHGSEKPGEQNEWVSLQDSDLLEFVVVNF